MHSFFDVRFKFSRWSIENISSISWIHREKCLPYLPMYNACQCILNTHPYFGLHFGKKKKGSKKQRKWLRKNIMIWKHSKNDDLIISSKMSLDAQAMKWSVLSMDSWWSATVKSWIQSAIHCIQLFDDSKNTMG